jgi:hypothetical protein
VNARDRLPVAIGAGLLVAMLGGFQAVVQASVDRGAARRAAELQAAQLKWRCRALRQTAARIDCLRSGDMMTAALP